jgi:hypothetical protein
VVAICQYNHLTPLFAEITTLTNVHNYYSSGEDTLNIAEDANVPPSYRLLTTPGGEFAFQTQELNKGGDLIYFFTFASQGGWGFNEHWDIYDANPSRRRLPAETANLLSNPGQLKENPFFKPFEDERLHDDAQGSQAAGEREVWAAVLAEGMPALSYPAGRDAVVGFQILTGNTDMNLSFQTGWPEELQGDLIDGAGPPRWRHGHFQGIAYRYIYGLYMDWISRGDLK